MKQRRDLRGKVQRRDLCACVYVVEVRTITQFVIVYVFLGNLGLFMGSLSWDISEGLLLCTSRHMFSLSLSHSPASRLSFIELQMPPYLGEWWRREECEATTCFSLTQDLVTHLTVNLIPSLSILSPGRVLMGVGGCRDQVQSPRCSMDKDDRVFTLLQLWMYADEDRVVGCNGIQRPPLLFSLLSCITLTLFLSLIGNVPVFIPLFDSPFPHSFTLLFCFI